MAIVNFDDRLLTFLNGFARNAASKTYITDFVARNSISIDGLIESDVFGTLSDFDASNPAPSLLNQVAILKAYLLQEPAFENYVITNIVQPLSSYANDAENRARNLDNGLLMAQWRRQISWIESHRANPIQTIQRIDKLQTLKKMARMLDSIEETSEQKNELNDWIETHATQLFAEPLGANELADRTTIFGAPQFSQFIRKFIKDALNTYKKIRDGIVEISQAPLSWRSIYVSFRRAFTLSIFIGQCALLPVSLLLTASREAAFFAERVTRKLINAIFPEGNGQPNVLSILKEGMMKVMPTIAYGIGMILMFNLSASLGYPITIQFIIGLQLFPASWSWGAIFAGFGAIAGTEFAMGTLLFCGRQMRNFWYGQPAQVVADLVVEPAVDPVDLEIDPAVAVADPELQTALAASLLEANSESASAAVSNPAEVVSEEAAAPVNRGPSLSNEQLTRLQRLFTIELSKNQPKSDDAKAIRAELQNLRCVNAQTPYFLTQRAQAVIQQAETLPAEFTGFPFPRTAPTGP